MKKLIIALILCFAGMTIFAQDLSYYTNEFTRTDGSFAERLAILETIQDVGISGAGEFYHEALKYFLLKYPDIRTNDEFSSAQRSAIIICNGLAAEKYTAAALELWETVRYFDVDRPRFDLGKIDGDVMQAALIALGEVNGKDFLPQIVQRLNDFNSQTFSSVDARRFAQKGVIGCVKALENFREASGYRPVFFVYVGGYDPEVRNIAAGALPNILDDPADIIIEIITDMSSVPRVKLEAWNEMLKTNAAGSSKAKVASAALATSFIYNTTNRTEQTNLSDMRKSAINAIREFGVADNSVYNNLERAYNAGFNNNSPDYDEIRFTLETLSAIKTDEAAGILLKFLQGLHDRRRSGPWGTKERRVFEWVVAYIGLTGTQNTDIRFLLSTIQRHANYTGAEQRMAADALSSLGR